MKQICGWTGGVVYMGCWIIIAISDVGKVPEDFGAYPWYLPLLVFIQMAPIFAFGVLAGKESE